MDRYTHKNMPKNIYIGGRQISFIERCKDRLTGVRQFIVIYFNVLRCLQVHYPSHPMQPCPIYFLTPRKCGLFGVCCEGIPQVNYLIDEGMSSSKGSSMQDHAQAPPQSGPSLPDQGPHQAFPPTGASASSSSALERPKCSLCMRLLVL
jgi:hypothetical protein